MPCLRTAARRARSATIGLRAPGGSIKPLPSSSSRRGAPQRDRYEPNDGGGTSSYPLYGANRQIDATLDYWNDRDDVYRVYLQKGERLVVSGGSSSAIRPVLALWRPGTVTVDSGAPPSRRLAVRPAGAGLSYGAPAAGWYLLDVRLTHATRGPYRLAVTKTR